jgi:hypothetical protein
MRYFRGFFQHDHDGLIVLVLNRKGVVGYGGHRAQDRITMCVHKAENKTTTIRLSANRFNIEGLLFIVSIASVWGF